MLLGVADTLFGGADTRLGVEDTLLGVADLHFGREVQLAGVADTLFLLAVLHLLLTAQHLRFAAQR